MKVLFLFPYPTGCAASQRFRFEQYLDILKENNVEIKLAPFLTEGVWHIFYKKGHYFQKTLALGAGFIRRFLLLFQMIKFDYVFIHRETFPIGLPIYEWFLAKVLKKKIIFDFDDAIWLVNSSESNRFFAPLKAHYNVFKICRWSYKVSVGNSYLLRSVLEHNERVVLNPTTIDTDHLHNRLTDHNQEKINIGWTGSHSTLKYLDLFFPIFRKLKEKYDVGFVIISDQPPDTNQDLVTYIPWKKIGEIDDLMNINIGIMPLSHDPWSEGKCGFKALQYMSLGIPALVSPVGVNEEIVDHDINGYICKSEDDWFNYIEILIRDRDKLKRMGSEGRKKVLDRYSVNSNAANFIHLFT